MPNQLSLFAESTARPDGFRLQPDFISADEERQLVGRIDELPLKPFQFGAFEGKRRVASFGWRYNFSLQVLEQADELPAWLTPFALRVETFASLLTGRFNRSFAPNTIKASELDGIAISRISIKSSDCRLPRPAGFAFVGRWVPPGSALPSKSNRDRFT